MSTATVSSAEVSTSNWQRTAWQSLRWVVFTGFVVVLILVPVTGHRVTPYSSLTTHLKRGEIPSLTVINALPPGSSGYSHPTIVWRDGWITREATVLQVSDTAQQPQVEGTDRQVVGDLDTTLRALHPGLTIHHASDRDLLVGGMPGWTFPSGLRAGAVVLLLCALGLLRDGPEPRFATRWAWAWCIFSPLFLITAPGYLLLGPGQNPDDATRRRSRRLTGGWAFLLVTFVLGGIGWHST